MTVPSVEAERLIVGNAEMDLSKHFREYRLVKLDLQVGSGDRLSLDCVVKMSTPPILEARFLPAQFPGKEIAPQSEVRITSMEGATIHAIFARIARVLDDMRLEMVVEGANSYGDTRRTFRIDTEIYLRCWRPSEERPGRATLEKVNLSGGGIQFITSEAVKTGDKLIVEMTLPGKEQGGVCCSCTIVRTSRKKIGVNEVALQFPELAGEDLETLLDFCIIEKVRQVRGKVQFLGDVLEPKID